MIKIATIFLSLLLFDCSTSSLPAGFNVLKRDSNETERISLSELDLMAREFIASYWGNKLDDIAHLQLVNATDKNDFSAIALTYQGRTYEPRVIVLFNKFGIPVKVMGYK